MEKLFPRTTVAGISLPRMLIGSNWLLGFSHTGAAADKRIRKYHHSREAMLPVFEAYLTYGIDAIMAPISGTPLMMEAIEYAEDKLQKKLIKIDTPILIMDDSAQGRKVAL